MVFTETTRQRKQYLNPLALISNKFISFKSYFYALARRGHERQLSL